MELGAVCGITGSFKRRVGLYAATYNLDKIATLHWVFFLIKPKDKKIKILLSISLSHLNLCFSLYSICSITCPIKYMNIGK